MTDLRAALVQTNMTVGALNANAGKILRLAHAAAGTGAGLIVFPELALSGYPPEDLVLKRHFLEDTARELERLAAELPPEPVIIVGAPHAEANRVHNSAFVFTGGSVVARYDKILLPNYGVFDEQRVFAPGTAPLIFTVAGRRVGLHICEDSWNPAATPCTALAGNVDLIINISGSPYHRGKGALREQTLRSAARAINAPLLYCNLVGGQDELVFDGASLFLDADGVRARAKQFEEDVLVVELGKEPSIRPAHSSSQLPTSDSLPPPRFDDLAEVYAALVLGLRDYTNKNGFGGVVLGLSGGIDSALVAALAVDALGAERVHAVTLPSRYSSAGTRGDAHQLAANLGIRMFETPIQGLFESFLKELAPLWPDRAPDTTEENIQARIRGVIVMALSNKFGWLVLTTGNKSELATGYCTLYGDMAGGFAVLKDVPKTLVFELAKWRNMQGIHRRDAENAEKACGECAGTGTSTSPALRPQRLSGVSALIPESIITRPPSAELRENQTDQDSLPPYDVLDGIIERYVERDWGLEAIIADGYDSATVKRVIRLIDINEYKRRQGAPGVKITPKAFGRDRRLPITNLYRERTGENR
ncbi:MAG TPA: NAD+ synthase [Kiritimatiellia bacterium]|nr:NAD+ synthase [Kiritimatiellia bacterium]